MSDEHSDTAPALGDLRPAEGGGVEAFDGAQWVPTPDRMVRRARASSVPWVGLSLRAEDEAMVAVLGRWRDVRNSESQGLGDGAVWALYGALDRLLEVFTGDPAGPADWHQQARHESIADAIAAARRVRRGGDGS